jgi:NAD(P)-dependent dehydrogenase (short-subunit alcohol dehydrogenase family)
MKPFDPRGSVVFVTGASAGIGAALAVQLEKLGSRLVLGARRVERLNALRATFQLPGEHLPVALDVNDPESVAKAFREVEGKFGKLDALVANAGVGGWFPVHATPEAEMRRIFETNVYGVVRSVRGAVPLLEKAGGGRIVLVSSVVGRRGVPMMGIYSASKFALHGLADAMRIELADRNITVSTICPGLTSTEFHDVGTGAKGSKPPASEGEPAEAVASGIVALLSSGKPEAHRAGPLSPKRWIGILNQLAPRFVDGQMVGYYKKRQDASS